MSNSKLLTTKEVARLCHVSDATLKRWEDAGLLRSERTSGGHRRFRADEVARFQKEYSLGVKVCHGDESPQTAHTRRKSKASFTNNNLLEEGSSAAELFQALIAGREEEATNLLINELLNGKPLPLIFDSTISLAMYAIGELWVRGELTVAQEHLATRATLNAVHKLRGVVPVAQPNNKIAMCCAVEGDFHELSIQLVQMTLESHGWEVLSFGANTPLYSFSDEVLHHQPDLVCISATVITDVERLARDYKDFYAKMQKVKIPVVLGGRVFTSENVCQRFPADHLPENFTDLSVRLVSMTD